MVSTLRSARRTSVATALAASCCLAGPAAADPLTFADVRSAHLPPGAPATGTVFTDLFANPGVVLESGSGDISIFVDVAGLLPAGGTDTLRLTLTAPGFAPVVRDVPVPNLGIAPPFTVLPRFDVPAFYEPVLMSLVVDLLRSSPDFIIPSGPLSGQAVDSFTYTFAVVQPVPEPGTLALVGSMLGAAALARRRRRAARPGREARP